MEKLLEHVVIIDKGNVILNDSLDNISQKSFYISGKKEDLEKLEFIKNKNIYKSFGSKQVYSYYGKLNENNLNLINKLDITLESMSLQDLFINSIKGDVF